jgi:peptidoglycan/LPS O-acetylase OafA/YrhL
MGAFRFFLALSVLVTHIPLYHFASGRSHLSWGHLHIIVTGGHAVFAFFILSGFYMSLILNEKYNTLANGMTRFYGNRLVRLYPAYLCALLMMVLLSLAAGHATIFAGDYSHPRLQWIGALLANLSMVGMDIFPIVDAQNWRLLVLTPAWTLSTEIYFYCLAPFIVQRSLPTLLFCTLAGITLRMYFFSHGYALDPYRYEFFPSDICFFLMGCIAYKLYAHIKLRNISAKYSLAVVAALICYLAVLPVWQEDDLDKWRAWGFYSNVMLATPFLFFLTSHSRFDRWLGDLSFPMYVCHVVAFSFVNHLQIALIDSGGIATALTILLAIFIHHFVEKPIETLRSRIRQSAPLAAIPSETDKEDMPVAA